MADIQSATAEIRRGKLKKHNFPNNYFHQTVQPGRSRSVVECANCSLHAT